jgi:hypothetical protein
MAQMQPSGINLQKELKYKFHIYRTTGEQDIDYNSNDYTNFPIPKQVSLYACPLFSFPLMTPAAQLTSFQADTVEFEMSQTDSRQFCTLCPWRGAGGSGMSTWLGSDSKTSSGLACYVT